MHTKSVQEQFDIISNGVVHLETAEELKAKLADSIKNDEPLRIKLGADPTAPDIHLGHTVPLMKLREFQDLGHVVIFIIGDFTGMVGDPSGRSQTRKMLSPEDIFDNALTYKEQIFKILLPELTEIRFNSEWFNDFDFRDVLQLTSRYNVARMLERDDFFKRYKEQKPITIMEFLYPLIQAYDSVATHTDIEIGGTDQYFNLLVGRTIMKEYGMPQQLVLTLPLLVGTDGVHKMSKSMGNYIGINDDPKDVFGKTMKLSDELMWDYYKLCTSMAPAEIDNLKAEIEQGRNPKEVKEQLACYLVETYYSKEHAEEERNRFKIQFGGRHSFDEIVDNIDVPVVELPAEALENGKMKLFHLVKAAGFKPSSKQSKTAVTDGSVSVNGERIRDIHYEVDIREEPIVQVGKLDIRKIKVRE